jgi:hypothetical protein
MYIRVCFFRLGDSSLSMFNALFTCFPSLGEVSTSELRFNDFLRLFELVLRRPLFSLGALRDLPNSSLMSAKNFPLGLRYAIHGHLGEVGRSCKEAAEEVRRSLVGGGRMCKEAWEEVQR